MFPVHSSLLLSCCSFIVEKRTAKVFWFIHAKAQGIMQQIYCTNAAKNMQCALRTEGLATNPVTPQEPLQGLPVESAGLGRMGNIALVLAQYRR